MIHSRGLHTALVQQKADEAAFLQEPQAEDEEEAAFLDGLDRRELGPAISGQPLSLSTNYYLTTLFPLRPSGV
ncbi:hypothetical protein DIPPA_30353 [Diplonema papillatum]|nr:hypothetical protein DIPPA_30353 [Diplonema papillatum]